MNVAYYKASGTSGETCWVKLEIKALTAIPSGLIYIQGQKHWALTNVKRCSNDAFKSG